MWSFRCRPKNRRASFPKRSMTGAVVRPLTLLIPLLMAAVLSAQNQAAVDNPSTQFPQPDLGTWKIAAIVYISPHGPSTLTAAKAHSLIGRSIALPPIGASVDPFTGETGDPDFQRSVKVKSRAALLATAHVSPHAPLDLPPQVTIFSHSIGNFWLRRDGTLLIQQGRYWFQLTKTELPPQPRAN